MTPDSDTSGHSSGNRMQAGEGSIPIERLWRWILGKGRKIERAEDFLQGFIGELLSKGFPLQRLFVAVKTLHPQIGGIAYMWSRQKGEIEVMTRERSIFKSQMYFDSPIERIYSGAETYIRRFLGGEDVSLDFPILHDLKKEGATDYAIFALEFGVVPSGVVSMTTDAPAGFQEADLEAFRFLLPFLSLVMESREWRRRSQSLLETYLGEDAGRRVLGGSIERGEGITIAAAIWYSDLRDFTSLSNHLSREAVIALLNDYFDAMTAPIQEYGGEILKFIGDAVLAIFPMRDDLDRDEKCRSALAAAKQALAGLGTLNEARIKANKIPLKAGIGLHAGSVTYGNIGALNRLDFTVIGPAVNLAARISGLCRQLDEPLLSSPTFASPCGTRLTSLGAYALQGFDGPQEVFGLPKEEIGRDSDQAA